MCSCNVRIKTNYRLAIVYSVAILLCTYVVVNKFSCVSLSIAVDQHKDKDKDKARNRAGESRDGGLEASQANPGTNCKWMSPSLTSDRQGPSCIALTLMIKGTIIRMT